MALRYYDDAIVDKLKRWIPEESNLRVLKPEESRRLFETKADDSGDKPIQLPIIALSRSKDFTIASNIKQSRSFDGLKVGLRVIDGKLPGSTVHLNVIPVQLEYQLDIYTKTYEEGDEYLRQFLFKLINNPALYIEIPYNNSGLLHIANIRVLDTISDTSDITEHLFAGQFTRWSIQLELQDAFLFSVPYRNNWKFGGVELATNSSLANPLDTDEIEIAVDENDLEIKEKI